MGLNAKQIAERFIGAAKKNPNDRQDIFRSAAHAFMGLAQEPKNARSSTQLAKIGLDFAQAATHARPPVMDDFTDLLRETQQAYDEVGDDPMDLIARRREIHDERTPLVPGQVMITPESFNRDTTLGRSAVIKFAPTNDEIAIGILQSQNVAFWQGTKKEAQAMSVDINLGFLPTLAVTQGEVFGGVNVRPFAEVEYGSDGNRTKVKFDLAFGNRCTVVGNYIAVTIGMDKPRLFPAVNSTVAITGGASIGAFSAESTAPLIATAYVDDLDFHIVPFLRNAVTIPIPLKAVQLLPIQSDAALGETATLEFLDYGGTLITNQFYVKSATTFMPTIPITGDLGFVRLFNTGPAKRNYRLPFQLGL